MSKKKTRRGKGPKYQRYFFACSDKMLVDKIWKPTTLLQTLTGEAFFGYVKLENEMLAIELPQTGGDVGGRYGVLVIPESEFDQFGTKEVHTFRKLKPRELHPSETGLVFAANFDPYHQCLGPLGEDLGDTYEGSVMLPYRMHVTSRPINELLAESGYAHAASSKPYYQFLNIPLQTWGFPAGTPQSKQVFGIDQQPRIHVHLLNGSQGTICQLVENTIAKLEDAPQ